MRKEVYICDHCGAEIHPFDDYTDMEFYSFDVTGTVDLCTRCNDELNKMVKKFVNK